jgi:hypothetical protein
LKILFPLMPANSQSPDSQDYEWVAAWLQDKSDFVHLSGSGDQT